MKRDADLPGVDVQRRGARWDVADVCRNREIARLLELNGKSAAIFLDDGDIEVFLAGIATASFMNTGQTCTTQGRILAPRSRYDEVVDALAGWTRSQTLGNPLDPSVTMGPMVSEHHLHRVLGHIDTAKNSSARLVTGGGRPSGLDRGWFDETQIVYSGSDYKSN